jgi:hypothetical protein
MQTKSQGKEMCGEGEILAEGLRLSVLKIICEFKLKESVDL